MTDRPSPDLPRSILLPAALDPARDNHGIAIAEALPGRDAATVAFPDVTYVFIVFTNRSGSTLLGELLAATGYFNPGEEALNADAVLAYSRAHSIDSFAQYFARFASERARNGHFVVKASIGQIGVLAGHGILGRILSRAQFLVVERMDKLGQAISWYIASQTGLFTSFHAPRAHPEPQYDRQGLANVMVSVAEATARTGLFMALNGLTPLHLTYELITTRPELAVRLVCDHLGAHAPDHDPARVRLRRQATARNDEWRARFLAGS